MKKPFNLIYEAEWNDIPCVSYPLDPEKWIRECFGPLSGTKVDTLFYNLCSSDGYCCQLNRGQILMENFDQFGDAWVWRYKENTKKLTEGGTNPPDMAVMHGHALGLKVIPVVRMNDMHDMFYKYEVSEFKIRNPHLLLGFGKYIDWEKGCQGHPVPDTIDSFTWGMFDYSHKEVRDHKLAIIEEFITRWDNDGISLDFDRDPLFFKEEGCVENMDIMTDLIRKTRKILDITASKRNRRLYLHVRVLPDMDICRKRGLDVKKWIEEGLVDAVTPGCGYMTFSLELQQWISLTKGNRCWIYPCVNKWKTAAVTRAWAKWMYYQGADGLYLFNWGHLLYGFGKQAGNLSGDKGTVYYDELDPCYYKALNEINDVDNIDYKDSLYALESVPHKNGKYESGDLHRYFRAIDAISLPIVLSIGKHRIMIPFAEKIDDETFEKTPPLICIRFLIENYTYPDKFSLSLNKHLIKSFDENKVKIREVFIMSNESWIEIPLRPFLLHQGLNEIIIDIEQLNTQMDSIPVLQKVELEIDYSSCGRMNN